jgi:hypothetical protein
VGELLALVDYSICGNYPTRKTGMGSIKILFRIQTVGRIHLMDQLAGLMASRRNEDIALDMMKFIASTTGYGKTGAPGAGFQGGTVNKAEDYAEHLLDLYTKCLNTINGRK